MSFDTACDFIKLWEGGYVNHPNDPGGETKYGISKRAFPYLDIKHLDYTDAKAIWKVYYWTPIKGDELPFSLALLLFDFAINAGVPTAVMSLQTILNVKADGKLGPKTLAAIKARTEKELFKKLFKARLAFYFRISANRSDLSVFLTGWINRLTSVIWFLGDNHFKDMI